MAGPIASMFVSLGLDAREFTKGIDGANKSLGGFTSNTKLAMMAVGAAATAGFAVLTKSALESEKAQGAFRAATGASADEAKSFIKDMDALAGSAGTTGVSFEKVAEAGTAVAQQFGLTGKAGAGLTDDFLEFARVTGQDATGAVNDFDAALDAFGLPAERAAGLMDQLVASNQKYGTDAGPAAVKALQDMAPALTAMGMGLDDGIELLNAFEASGVDAGSAAAALNRAVKSLKPGENLDDLIAQLGTIDDPLVRAQEAIKIFGKQGAKIAALIKPGMTSLDEFGISIEEAADASDKAADSMLTTGDKIRGFFDKFQAGVRDIATDLGTLPALLGGVVSGLTAAAPTIKAALSKLGQDHGVAYGKAFYTGAVAALFIIGSQVGGVLHDTIFKVLGTSDVISDSVVAAVNKAHPELQAAGGDIGTALGDGISEGLPKPGDPDFIGPVEGLVQSAVPVAEAGGADVGSHFASGVEDRHDEIKRKLLMIPQVVHEVMLEAHKVAAWGGAQTPREFSEGARSTFDSVKSAFNDLKQLMKDTLSPAKKEAELIGIATSKRLAKALNDGRPEVRGEAQQIALDTIAELRKLNPASSKIGELTTKLLASALPNERPALQDAIDLIMGTVTGPLSVLPAKAETSGERITAALARGLRNNAPLVRTAANNLARIITNRLQIDSPAKEGIWSQRGGPMARMFASGQKIGGALADGLRYTYGDVASAAGGLAGAVTPQTGLAFATSRVSSLGVSAPGLAVAASHAPITINIGRVYGGPAGLRELNAEIQAALRQSTRGANREVGR